MSIRNPKQALYEQFAIVAKALGHPQRLELIEHLAQGPRSVEALATKLGLPIANISQHLQNLRRAGLVTAERDGKFVNYRLADETVLSLFASRPDSRRAPPRRGRPHRARLFRCSRRHGAGHARGADRTHARRPGDRDRRAACRTNSRSAMCPARSTCRSATSMRVFPSSNTTGKSSPTAAAPGACMSFEAVAALRGRGFKARRLEDGMPEWKAAGLPVETAVQRRSA